MTKYTASANRGMENRIRDEKERMRIMHEKAQENGSDANLMRFLIARQTVTLLEAMAEQWENA